MTKKKYQSTMIKDVDVYVEFLEHYNINDKQFILAYLLFKGKTSTLKRYITQVGQPTEVEYARLLKLDFIVERRKGERVSHRIGEGFKKAFIDKDEAARAFWYDFPIHLDIDGKQYPAKGMDMDKFTKIYADAYGGFIKEHDEIMKDLQYGIANNLIRVKLETYMTSHMWEQHRKLRNEVINTKPRSSNVFDNDL